MIFLFFGTSLALLEAELVQKLTHMWDSMWIKQADKKVHHQLFIQPQNCTSNRIVWPLKEVVVW